MKYFNNLEKYWLVFNMNIDDIKHLPKTNNLSTFFRDIIMCWVQTGGGQLPNTKHFANIRKQLIWGNKYIKVNGNGYFVSMFVLRLVNKSKTKPIVDQALIVSDCFAQSE